MAEKGESEPAVVVGKTYDFVLWLLPKVEKFTRSYKFSVGDRLASFGLELLRPRRKRRENFDGFSSARSPGPLRLCGASKLDSSASSLQHQYL